MEEMWHTRTTKFDSAIKKNEMMSFSGKWMGLGNSMLSKISQTQRSRVIWNLERKKEKMGADLMKIKGRSVEERDPVGGGKGAEKCWLGVARVWCYGVRVHMCNKAHCNVNCDAPAKMEEEETEPKARGRSRCRWLSCLTC